MLDRRSGCVFRLLYRLLNRSHGLVQIHDDAFARPPRFGHAMAAVAQTAVGNFRHQCASLGAAYINRGQEMLVLIRHSYRASSPLTIAALGFAGLAAAREEFRFAFRAEPGADAFCPLLEAAGALTFATLALALALNLVCRR